VKCMMRFVERREEALAGVEVRMKKEVVIWMISGRLLPDGDYGR
jgi:hypothetical protein